MNQKYKFKSDPYSSHTSIAQIIRKQFTTAVILDVGCGPGFLGRAIKNKKYTSYGIDNDEEVLRFAKKYYKNIFKLNVEQEKFTNPVKFDILIFGDILEHLINPQVILNRYSAKYLKNNGKVIISLPNAAHAFVRFNIMLGKFEYMDKGILDITHLRFFTFNSMRKLISDSGLKIERYHYTPIPLPLLIPSTNKTKPLFFLHQFNNFITGLWEKLLAYQFIFVCSKQQIS